MTNEPSSPVCYAAEADAYMGFADREEILRALGELLEAERAVARAARIGGKAAEPAGYSELMRLLGKDKAGWCAALARRIRQLGGSPPRKARGPRKALWDPFGHLLALNRDQARILHRLERLLPRVRDDALHAELKAMADSHRAAIALADAFLERKGAPAPPARQDAPSGRDKAGGPR